MPSIVSRSRARLVVVVGLRDRKAAVRDEGTKLDHSIATGKSVAVHHRVFS
jgi:hypothetical protein